MSRRARCSLYLPCRQPHKAPIHLLQTLPSFCPCSYPYFLNNQLQSERRRLLMTTLLRMILVVVTLAMYPESSSHTYCKTRTAMIRKPTLLRALTDCIGSPQASSTSCRVFKMDL